MTLLSLHGRRWHIANVFTLEWLAHDGAWRSNYETRVCECMWLSDYGSPNSAKGKFGAWPPVNCTQGVNLTVPKTQISGAGSFYNYVSDEDVLFTDHRNYRHLFIGNIGEQHIGVNTGNRLSFYSMNLEHGMSETNGEINHARNIDIYGLKKEGSTAILWVRDSSDVNIFGEAGASCLYLLHLRSFFAPRWCICVGSKQRDTTVKTVPRNRLVLMTFFCTVQLLMLRKHHT